MKKWGIAYVICLHLFIGLVLLKSDFINQVKSQFKKPPPKSELTYQYHRHLRYHKRKDGNVPKHSVVFIGDSIIEGITVSAVASPAINYGIGGDTTIGVLQRIETYTAIKTAKAIVLEVGFNDMQYRLDAEIVKNQLAITQKIPPSIPVIIIGILPIDSKAREQWFHISAERIANINNGFKLNAQLHDNLYFIDPKQYLADQRGNLKTAYHIGDGTHLNSAGNEVLIKLIKEKLKWITDAQDTNTNRHQPLKINQTIDPLIP